MQTAEFLSLEFLCKSDQCKMGTGGMWDTLKDMRDYFHSR